MKTPDQVSAGDNLPDFNTLFHRYNAHVKCTALNICGNTAAAEDAVQDAWIAAYTHIHQLRSSDAFLPWLKRIVVNACYQSLKNDRHLVLSETLPVTDRLIEDSIESTFEQVAGRDKLYAVLSSLSLPLRQTVMLRYLSGYTSYADIAAITGVPIGTVRSRLSDSKKKLGALLNQPVDAGPDAFNTAAYWNHFYQDVCPGTYTHANLLTDFFKHLQEDLAIIFTSGKKVVGKKLFQNSIYDDLEHGSRLTRVESCITSGDLSLLKVSFENSAEHPAHCPPDSYLTFLRKGDKMTMMRMYYAERQLDGLVSDFS